MNNTIWALLIFLPLALYFLNILLNVIDAELQQTHRQLEASSTISISKRTGYLPPHKRTLLLALERAFEGRYRVYPSAMLQDVLNLSEHRDSAESEQPFASTSLALDFVLCDPKTLNVVCAVEAQPRSDYLSSQSSYVPLAQVLEAGGVPLVVLPAMSEYKSDTVARQVEQELLMWLSKTHHPQETKVFFA